MTVEHAAGTGRLVARALDGCLASGNIPLAGAATLAEWLGPRLWLASNNPTEVATKLSAVLTSPSQRGAVMIADNPATDIASARTAGIPAILLGPSPHADIPNIRALLPALGATP